MERKVIVAMVVGTCLGLGACGGGSGGDTATQPMMEDPNPPTLDRGAAQAHVLPDENGAFAGLRVGDTQVLLSDRITGVSGGGSRGEVGSVLHDGNVVVRHITAHWNAQTGDVDQYDYISYGAWAIGTAEPRTDSTPVYDLEEVGGAYLGVLNEMRTPVAEMPLTGTATYNGQFTGFSKAQGVDQTPRHATGDVSMTADFADREMTVDLVTARNNRIVLGGGIYGNQFEGETIHQMSGSIPIQSEGAEAYFAGAFYGDAAKEAAGVFEVIGGSAQNPGYLVGAFGGRKPE